MLIEFCVIQFRVISLLIIFLVNFVYLSLESKHAVGFYEVKYLTYPLNCISKGSTNIYTIVTVYVADRLLSFLSL